MKPQVPRFLFVRCGQPPLPPPLKASGEMNIHFYLLRIANFDKELIVFNVYTKSDQSVKYCTIDVKL